ncbi:MAG: SH3 domain-containing protein [Dehalococcoidia bacterium]|nr:SH3 domain-containing protein [Dehalococcoidia bacterium]
MFSCETVPGCTKGCRTLSSGEHSLPPAATHGPHRRRCAGNLHSPRTAFAAASAQGCRDGCGGAGRDRTVVHPRLPARRFRTASVRIAALLALLWLALGPAAAQVAYAAPMEAWRANQSVEARPVPLQPGTRAVVRSGGECLRLREAPRLEAEVITCLQDGTSVMVLAALEESDGYRWQQVLFGEDTGWAADVFLEPYDGPAECSGNGTLSLTKPGLSGDLPVQGGVGLVVWGGGTVNGILTTAAAEGCHLASIWANRAGGGLVGYITNAPDFVNSDFLAQFPGGAIAAGTPLVTICGTQARSTQAAGLAGVPVWGGAPTRSTDAGPPGISAEAAIVVDEASGAVLFDKNAHESLPPASLTKVITAIIAMEGADPNTWLTTNVDSRQMPGSSLMGLLPGDCYQLRDLLYGLMLPSGNDAALAISRHVAGSDEAFLAQMHALLNRLGLHESHFVDPHGLGGDGHTASAYDLAMLSRYAMAIPEFRAIVATPVWTSGGSRQLVLYNVNGFLTQFKGADGLKTGYTGKAGRTLIASATREGHRLYAVLLDAPERDHDAAALLEWAFGNHTWP